MLPRRKACLGLAVLLGAVAGPALADSAAMSAKADADRALGTINDMQSFFTTMKQRQDAAWATYRASIASTGTPSGTTTTADATNGQGRLYTVVLRGAMCPICAGKLNDALASIPGTTVVTAPQKGAGRMGTTTAVVKMADASNMDALKTAVANADTPEKAQVKPGVFTVFTGRLKAGTKPQDMYQAFRKANLVNAQGGGIKADATPDQMHDALKQADLIDDSNP